MKTCGVTLTTLNLYHLSLNIKANLRGIKSRYSQNHFKRVAFNFIEYVFKLTIKFYLVNKVTMLDI